MLKKVEKPTKSKPTNEDIKPTKLTISPPHFQVTEVMVVGDNAPYVANKFSSYNRDKMIAKQLQGSQSRKGQKRAPKDFKAIYEGMAHRAAAGWYGIPAKAFRDAMVEACSIVGFKMTLAKKAIFIEADGVDADDGQPLVKIIGKPTRKDTLVRLADGSTDILPRPMFFEWSVKLRLKWDADLFSAVDMINLLSRAGQQVGVGAGRPASRKSTGMGWGIFYIETGKGK